MLNLSIPKRRFFTSAWYKKMESLPPEDLYKVKLAENFDSFFWIVDANHTWLKPEVFNTQPLDLAVNWAQANNADIRCGGVLCPWLIAPWYKLDPHLLSPVQFKYAFEQYIKMLMGYKFYSYDFLLEKVDYKGNIINDYLNEKLGVKHIEEMLEYASAIKGDSKLVLSDFGYKLTDKWDGNIKLLRQFKGRNLIDAVAIQVQINIIPGFRQDILSDLIKRIQDEGYEVELPECTVWENIYTPPNMLGLQELIYNQVFDLVEEHQINTFGYFSPFDAHPWVYSTYGARPGLWDKDYRLKKWAVPFLDRVRDWVKAGA